MAVAKLFPPEDPRSPDNAISHLSLEAQAYIRLLSLPPLDYPEDDPRVQKRQAALDAMVNGFAEEELEAIAIATTRYEELLEQERIEIEREFAEFDPQAEIRAAREAEEARRVAADTEPPKLSDGVARYIALVQQMDTPDLKAEDPAYGELLGSANAAWGELTLEEQQIAEGILQQQQAELSERSSVPLDDRAVPVIDPDPAATGIVDESDGDEVDGDEVDETDAVEAPPPKPEGEASPPEPVLADKVDEKPDGSREA
jgi:hypothetical protein